MSCPKSNQVSGCLRCNLCRTIQQAFTICLVLMSVAFGIVPWVLLWVGGPIEGTYEGRRFFPLAESRSFGWLWFAIPGLLLMILITVWLWCERKRETLTRMRHAIGCLFLIGGIVASWSIYAWPWLSGPNKPNSEIIRDIGLAVAAVLTLVFVIWRERIASEDAGTKRLSVALQNFRRAAQLLECKSAVNKIVGIRMIREIGAKMDEYRCSCLRLVKWVRDNPGGDNFGEVTREAKEAICVLEKKDDGRD